MDKENFGIYGLFVAFILAINDVISFGIAKSTFLKTYSIGWLIIPVILYGLQLPLFYYGLKFSSMSILNISWNLISNILVTLVGFFYFKEKVSNVEMVGLIFAFISIGCFTYHDILLLTNNPKG